MKKGRRINLRSKGRKLGRWKGHFRQGRSGGSNPRVIRRREKNHIGGGGTAGLKVGGGGAKRCMETRMKKIRVRIGTNQENDR